MHMQLNAVLWPGARRGEAQVTVGTDVRSKQECRVRDPGYRDVDHSGTFQQVLDSALSSAPTLLRHKVPRYCYQMLEGGSQRLCFC